jgi:hypothetical protein
MTIFCTNCGAAADEGVSFCEACGIALENDAEQTQEQLLYQSPQGVEKKRSRGFRRGYLISVIIAVIVISFPIGLNLHSSYQSRAEKNRLRQQIEETFNLYVPIQSEQNAEVNSFFVTENNLAYANSMILSLFKRGLEQSFSLGGNLIYQETERFDSSEYTNLDPATSIIYPGAIFTGDSIFTDYAILPLARNPIEIAANFPSAQAESMSIIVDDPRFSTVTLARNQLVEMNLTSDVAANFTFSSKVYNEEREVRAFLGVSGLPPVISSFVDLGGSVGGSRSSKRTNMLVKFTQVYYTLSVHPPETPIGFFRDGFDMASLGELSPAYVSEVSYGRIGVLSINSDSTANEINAAIKASVDLVGLGGELGGSHKRVLEQSEMNLYIIGGSATQAGNAIEGYNGFMQFITGGNSIMEEKQYAVPIAYRLRYVSDNSIVPGGMVTSVRTLEGNPENMKITVTLNSIDTELRNVTVSVNTTNINAVAKQDFYEYKRVDKVLSQNALTNPIELLFIGRDDTAYLDFYNISVNEGFFYRLEPVSPGGTRILFSELPIGTTQRQIQFASNRSNGEPVLTLNLTVKKEAVELRP